MPAPSSPRRVASASMSGVRERQHGMAHLERLEEHGDAARTQRDAARVDHVLGLEHVMQDRRADGNVERRRDERRGYRVDRDQRIAAAVARLRGEMVAQDREQRCADVRGHDERVGEPVEQRDDGIARSRADVEDRARRRRPLEPCEGVVQQHPEVRRRSHSARDSRRRARGTARSRRRARALRVDGREDAAPRRRLVAEIAQGHREPAVGSSRTAHSTVAQAARGRAKR